jgi:signal transduction histidine kinase
LYYFTIKIVAKSQLDQNLELQLRETQEFLNTSDEYPQQFDPDKDHAIFYPVPATQKVTKRFFDTIYNNPATKKAEPGRAVEDALTGKDHKYRVIIMISRTGNFEFVKMISIITFLLSILMLSLQFVTSKYMFTNLWKSFSETLSEIKNLKLEEVHVFKKTQTTVAEFKELNDVVSEMSEKWKKSYFLLKNFSENASHEMMTPLAVITSKLDQLIQGENLTNEQMELISDIYFAVSRSSRLNQSLILLTNIENNLHPENELLNITAILTLKISQFEDLLKENKLTIVPDFYEVNITANKYLLDILLNNLLTNAIWHNINEGKIFVSLSDGKLIVANTGLEKELQDHSIFNRFHKGRSSQGMGLGLALIKNICEHYSYDLSYTYQDNLHVFSIRF